MNLLEKSVSWRTFPGPHQDACRRAHMSLRNHSKIFPSLDFDTLQTYAKVWANHLEDVGFPFRRITLFKPPLSFEEYGKEYIVVFEFPDYSNTPELETFKHVRRIWEGDLEDPVGRLWQNDSFRKVYKEKPPHNWLDSWVFQVGAPENVDEELSWVLFDSARKDL